MARAGYCSECQANVWLTEDGGCNAGHPASCISNEYETDPSIASGTAEGSAEIRPRKFGRWVVLGLVALVVLLGCGLAAGALLPRPP